MDEAEVTAMHEKRLKAFKRRADEIRSCRLFQHPYALLWGKQLIVEVRSDGQNRIGRNLPTKAEVAYAVTLIRALTLNDENIYHQKVLGSIKHFADESLHDRIKATKKAWKEYPPRSMQLILGREDDPDWQVETWDNDLANAFVYGNLVHATAEQADLVDEFAEEDVLFAASGAMSTAFMLVHNTVWLLHQVRPDLQDEPVLPDGTKLPGGKVIKN
ncbi:hypothetical protein [Calidifontibacter terrae]